MNQANHWKSTEFWSTTIAQLLSALALFGFVTPNDSKSLEEASNKIVAAVFLFLSNAAIVIYYIRSRLHMHLTSGEGRGARGENLKPQGESSSPGGAEGGILTRIIDKAPLIAAVASLPLLLGALAGPAKAEILPWRQQMKQLHQQLQNQLNQHPQTPAPAPQIHIIQLPPAYQQLPIQGSPQQVLPIQGSPLQPLPVPGSPLQQLPIQGAPQQPLPIGGSPLQQLPIQGQPQVQPQQPAAPAAPPKQQLPIQGAPIQQIPITPPAPPAPPAAAGPQRLSIYIRSLYRLEVQAP